MLLCLLLLLLLFDVFCCLVDVLVFCFVCSCIFLCCYVCCCLMFLLFILVVIIIIDVVLLLLTNLCFKCLDVLYVFLYLFPNLFDVFCSSLFFCVSGPPQQRMRLPPPLSTTRTFAERCKIEAIPRPQAGSPLVRLPIMEAFCNVWICFISLPLFRFFVMCLFVCLFVCLSLLLLLLCCCFVVVVVAVVVVALLLLLLLFCCCFVVCLFCFTIICYF